ncbi:hypothetical protein MOBUDSM44075_03943 [Mycolicibacterium obuense]|uniref:Uncharacterized protein n=2 Tax=Mycolicibacterium obuense TaxID=1807 RepID=A0A0J6VRN0_9MYCO|nr:hypothetical protein MOBUDSM44075_03943 [Mycolicibacterium obuense]
MTTVGAQMISAASQEASLLSLNVAASTATALARARRDLQHAIVMGVDAHRRRQYALSARDEAATVLLAADASSQQLRYARVYLAAAQRFSDSRATPVMCDRREGYPAAS